MSHWIASERIKDNVLMRCVWQVSTVSKTTQDICVYTLCVCIMSGSDQTIAQQPLLPSNSDPSTPALQREIHPRRKSARIKARRLKTKLWTPLVINLSNSSSHITYHLFTLPKYRPLPHYLWVTPALYSGEVSGPISYSRHIMSIGVSVLWYTELWPPTFTIFVTKKTISSKLLADNIDLGAQDQTKYKRIVDKNIWTTAISCYARAIHEVGRRLVQHVSRTDAIKRLA